MATTTAPEKKTVAEAAEYWRVSTKTVRRWISQGLIRAERVGPRLIRIDVNALENIGNSLQFSGDHE